MENFDELMEEPPKKSFHEAFFQFGEEEPVRIAYLIGGEFSLTLKAENGENAEVEFSDGKGKTFKIFLKETTEDELYKAFRKH